MASGEDTGSTSVTGTVLPEWIDINGHMNVAYYVLAFDKAVDRLFARVGVTDDYIRTENGTTFAVECHITYRQELQEGQPYRVVSEILAYDEKRVHQFQRMYHADEGFVAATAEWMNLHVSLDTRRVCRWPAPVLQALSRLAAGQEPATYPEEAGKRMGIRRPLWSMAPKAGDG